MSLKVKYIVVAGMFALGVMVGLPLKAADPVLPEIAQRTHKYTLSNGLTVLISEIPSSSAVSVYGLVKTGSATEGRFLGTGISHFLEHMLFKGTVKRGVGQISREIQAMGGEINASTSFDYTIYTITVPQSEFVQGLDILSDMLTNSVFDPEQIEKERDVVYGEMRMRNDRPEWKLSEGIMKTVYTQHPYRLPIIGYEDLLKELKNEDFVAYYRERYIPDNTIISVAGNLDPESTLLQIREAFETFERRRPVLRDLVPEPQQISPRRYEEEYPTEVTRASLVYSGVSLLHEDLFALDLLAAILGQGESSRLYLEIFKKQRLVQAISASNFTPVDKGLFEINFIPNDPDVDKVVQAIKSEIRLLQQKGVAPAELEKVKRQSASSYIFARQTSAGVAYSTAMDEAMAGDHAFSQKYVEGIARVTNDDIRRVANQYLKVDASSVVVLKPEQETFKAAVAEKFAKADIKEIKFDNGLTVLLKENKSLPIASVNLLLGGGVGQEPAELNGVSELLARTWTKGTKTRSADDIAYDVESRGISISAFSGRNSFGIRMDVLSQDLEFGLMLLEDLVKNPAFDEQEFAKEKDRLRFSIKQLEDDIVSIASRALRQTLFLSHPLRREALGTLASIEPITAQDVRGFYQQFISPSNMVLSVFGNFDEQQVLEMIRKKFADLKNKDVPLASVLEPPSDQTREKTLTVNKEQAMVVVGFQGPGFRGADRYGVEVLASLLGSSFSGRIFNRIRDEFGQAYTLGGSFTPGRDLGLISFYVLTKAESLEKVKGLLTEIIQEVQETPVTDQELAEMKRYLTGTFAMDIETNSQLSFISSLDELYGLGYNHYQSYAEKINQITKEDIQRLAATYLDINKAAIIVAVPEFKK